MMTSDDCYVCSVKIALLMYVFVQYDLYCHTLSYEGLEKCILYLKSVFPATTWVQTKKMSQLDDSMKLSTDIHGSLMINLTNIHDPITFYIKLQMSCDYFSLCRHFGRNSINENEWH